MEHMIEIMDNLRDNPPKAIAGLQVIKIDDYKRSISVNLLTGISTTLTLPKSDVIAFGLPDSASVIIRPSGTEPKIKVYYTTTGKTREDATSLELKLAADFKSKIGF
jgi:phosphoglucomutase